MLPSDWGTEAGLLVPSSPAAKRLNRRLKYVLDLTDQSIAALKHLSVNHIQDKLDYVFVNELSKGQRLGFLEFWASTAVTVAMYGKYIKQSERNEMNRIITLL